MFDLPLEYALVSFEDAKFSGRIAPELIGLAQRGIVRIVDIVLIHKDHEGVALAYELSEFEPELYKQFVPVGEHVASHFTMEDLGIAASRLPEGSAALLLLWENLWVAGLREAIVEAGGVLVERAQIAPEVVDQFKTELASESGSLE